MIVWIVGQNGVDPVWGMGLAMYHFMNEQGGGRTEVVPSCVCRLRLCPQLATSHQSPLATSALSLFVTDLPDANQPANAVNEC